MPLAVQRVFHLNVNCSALDVSLAFYCDALGLTRATHTVSPTQSGEAFGLEQAAWDAWILHDDRGYDGVVLDLLEWQVPRPIGAPPASANTLGFVRLGFTSGDLDATHRRLRAAGTGQLSEPHEVAMSGAPTIRTFIAADPDGTAIEVVSGTADRFSFVVVNCSDLDRSVEFYEQVLGFAPRARFAPGPRDETALGLGPDAEWEMAYLDDPRGNGTFAIDLVQWHRPEPVGAPSSEANRVGPFRLALLTDDIDRDHAALVEAGVACLREPTVLDMGPGIPSLRAVLFPDPDGTMLELIEAPSG